MVINYKEIGQITSELHEMFTIIFENTDETTSLKINYGEISHAHGLVEST
jgi:hypothetical protein